MNKKNSLFRLTQSLYNTPHFISTSVAEHILSYLQMRNFQLEVMHPEKDREEESPTQKDEDLGIAVVNVHGSMTYKPVQALCAEVGTSYQELEDCFHELAASGISTIVMDFATGGGEATHLFEIAANIRKICDDNNITLLSYIDQCACSAGYGLACIADEVIINPSGYAGSIGAVVALMDKSKAMEQMGVKPVFITSGESKVPFNAEGGFKEDFISHLQLEVDKLAGEFASHVSKYTGLSEESILQLQAATFNAEAALEKGLVNKIMTKNEFAAYVSAKHNKKNKGATYAGDV